jgi:hypothetical protein
VTGSAFEEEVFRHDARFEAMEQVLHGLETTSDHVATTLNMPPVDIAGLRREWVQFRRELAAIPPSGVPALPRIEGVWRDLEAAWRFSSSEIRSETILLPLTRIRLILAPISGLRRSS